MTLRFELLAAVQSRTARLAVGASTVRGLGVPGVVDAARTFLRTVPLRQYGTSNAASFRRYLDETTLALQATLPKGARHWGVARKVLNIFLRDSLYTIYLNQEYGLAAAERFFEIPLDSVTGLKLVDSCADLPKWAGVRHLTSALSDRFQEQAAQIARRHGTRRVHLDAFWWSVSRDA